VEGGILSDALSLNVRKVVIAGPVGSGKTTALRTIFKDKLLSTDANYSNTTPTDAKKTTTVAMDYGVLLCPELPFKLHLYTVPGQERFQFMWEIIGKNADGLIVLIDAKQSNPIAAVHLYMKNIIQFLHHPVVLVALNKLTAEQRLMLRMPPYLRHDDIRLRLTSTDVRDEQEVLSVLRVLIDEMAIKQNGG